MSIHPQHLRSLVLLALPESLYSRAAANLIVGTIATESHGGTYLWQLGNGPAIGIAQMEPATFDWLQGKYGERYGFKDRQASEMAWDLKLAILLCRLRYLVVIDPLPRHDDLEGLAKYWKKYYNTIHGAGTVDGFISNYNRYAI